METGVMSSGAGEVGELVKDGSKIQQTPAQNASVQTNATLADFVPRNNVEASRAAFRRGAAVAEKSMPDQLVIS